MKRIEELSRLEPARSNRTLAAYIKAVREICRDLHMELACAEEELRAALSTVPVMNGGAFSTSQARRRARLVSRHLADAADAARAAGARAVKTLASFERHYEAELAPRRQATKKRFDFE